MRASGGRWASSESSLVVDSSVDCVGLTAANQLNSSTPVVSYMAVRPPVICPARSVDTTSRKLLLPDSCAHLSCAILPRHACSLLFFRRLHFFVRAHEPQRPPRRPDPPRRRLPSRRREARPSTRRRRTRAH